VVVSTFLALTLASVPLQAATASGSFSVSATVLESCAASAGPVSYASTGWTTVSGSSTVSVQCSHSTPYNVAMDSGAGSGATVAARNLSGTASVVLRYWAGTGRRGGFVSVRSADQGTSGSGQSFAAPLQVPVDESQAEEPDADAVIVTITY